MKRTQQLKEQKQIQNRAYCSKLLRALHGLSPSRLQWCEHPCKDALCILTGKDFTAEYIEVEFTKPKIEFSICLTPTMCDIEKIIFSNKQKTKNKRLYAVIQNHQKNKEDYFQRITSLISKNIKGEV